VSTISLAVDQTCNECHGELGTLVTGGLHPQQLLGNTGDKPYLSSVRYPSTIWMKNRKMEQIKNKIKFETQK
jgi:hypothetical protein